MIFNLNVLLPVILRTKYFFYRNDVLLCSAANPYSRWCPSQVVGPLFETRAGILVKDPCVEYKFEVRCQRLNGSGYWSDWSKAGVSSVNSIKGETLI